MKRDRSLERWSNLHKYQSMNEFLTSQIGQGVHSIPLEGQHLDLMVLDRGAPTTLVVFNAKLTSQAKTTPSLQGVSLSRDVGANLIAVSDPTIELGDVDVAWYLGNSEIGSLPLLLGPVINHVVHCLGSARNILFGSSGGGFAVLTHAPHVENSVALIFNPRTDLMAHPKPDLDSFQQVALGDVTNLGSPPHSLDVIQTSVITELDAKTLSFPICLYQNLGDRKFYFYQSFPLLRRLVKSPNIFFRADWDGVGHIAPPRRKLQSIISTLGNMDISLEQAVKEAKFRPPIEEN